MILVADQNRMTAEMLVRRLRAEGWEADSASHATSATLRLEAGGVKALIVDPGLPGGGLSVLSAVRTSPTLKTLPVIVFGTSDLKDDIDRAIRLGASAYLTKGRVTPAVLLSKLKDLLVTSKSEHAQGAYYLTVQAVGDAGRLGNDIGAPGLCCKDCNSPLSLYVQRDFSRWGKWLFGTFGCLPCARRAEENIQTVPMSESLAELQAGIQASGGAR